MIYVEIADSCSSDINTAVDNAFVSCSTPVLCTAECYRGYIFPFGSIEESYSCQNGVWTPMLFSCKRTLYFYSVIECKFILCMVTSSNRFDLYVCW